ncbi:MAG: MFS transporter [Massilia sp.]
MSLPASAPAPAPATAFTPYQKFVAGLLAFLQFAVILDFMIIAPLGAMIMPALGITPKQFGMVVSAYAFSAALSGLFAAGFADRYDRKKLLLFFYFGFLGGTLWCGFATSYAMLLAARVTTGIFGGVIGSILMAIATDLYAPALRGRVMGIVQTAFAASQVLGLPVGLYLSNHWTWHAPFFAMVALGAAGGLALALWLRPLAGHLDAPQERSAFAHLLHTVADRHHIASFVATALLTTGAFMLMPFSSEFTVNNLGIPLADLPMVYLASGLCMIFFGPMVGKASDAFGKMPLFLFGCLIFTASVAIYTRMGASSLPLVILVNIVLFLGIVSRMIPFQAMVSSVPQPAQRGAFNAVKTSIQQFAGGFAALLAGHIVEHQADGRLAHMDMVGNVVIASTVVSFVLATRIARELAARGEGGERAKA